MSRFHCFPVSRRLIPSRAHPVYRHFATMDISSGEVSFGRTCPGTLMQDLQRNNSDQVAKIKKLQTSLSRHEVTYQCPVPCRDLDIVYNFITSINALEELSVLNYERDVSGFWPTVFHHANSLHSLAIHTPPQNYSHIWTPATIATVASGLGNLKNLEIDLPLKEAESYVKGVQIADADFVMGEASKLHNLESILVNVPLQDAASPFADQHTWNAMGCISFPHLNEEVCKRLARTLLGMFPADAALKRLEVRFVRRCWDDRCQFWTLACSTRAERGMGGNVTVEGGQGWGGYLAPWPEYGGLLWNLMSRI
ncbi:hypothetical protein B0T25DRAFT_585269 [Lasiosphaeria hispida]|uniref:Uncharacterized protein n=1 Tax=Lasiosphaeria hispida TaxID=260671 RepID=A0AAJ0HA27_9PEZI|nr:hypothetical protein B0T25DRAFT_585269 [Lasiosphaeria hispida]